MAVMADLVRVRRHPSPPVDAVPPVLFSLEEVLISVTKPHPMGVLHAKASTQPLQMMVNSLYGRKGGSRAGMVLISGLHLVRKVLSVKQLELQFSGRGNLFLLLMKGFNQTKNSASIRTGCTARIRLLRTKDDGWYVSSMDDNHNHRFSESFGQNKQWNSHCEIDSVTKDFIRRMRENNISVGRICNILGISDGNHSSAFRRESVRSICSKVAQEELKDDIGKTMKLLEEMKSLDPMFQVRFQLDSERRIRSMLWCSGKNIMDYALFGDAITFDTTYRTNLYSLPFGLFMGVNNHFQSVVFGGVLLTTEKTADFEWAFKSFVDIMGGQAPKTISSQKKSAEDYLDRSVRCNGKGDP